MNENTV